MDTQSVKIDQKKYRFPTKTFSQATGKCLLSARNNPARVLSPPVLFTLKSENPNKPFHSRQVSSRQKPSKRWVFQAWLASIGSSSTA